MEHFRKLGVIEPILSSIREQKFEMPTEIQQKAIPLVLEGKDVVAASATGSGKTLVFGSVLIQHSEKGKGIQALVLVPTRELAEQVTKAMVKFSKYKPLHIVDVYGGLSINPQIERLRTADVVVGTPGRILDHLQRGTIDLSRVKILVLDEADRMLDMGFIQDVENIIRQCPVHRQTMMFSATIPEEVLYISKRYMRNSVNVSANTYVDPSKLHQAYYDVQDNMKFSLLVHLLKHEKSGLVMVFCNTRRATNFVAKNLNYSGIESQAIHGGFSQNKRSNVMRLFHTSKVYVLVCTDLAARGLDIQGVSHVYNYDAPKESKQYLHRVGRTARAGREGKAINLISSRDHENFSRVLRDNDIQISREDIPRIEKVKIRWSEKPRFRASPSFSRGPRRGWHTHRRNFAC